MFEQAILPIRARLAAAGVRQLGIFGSMARGEARSDSDIDILVSFSPSQRTFDNLVTVHDALQEVFDRKVEIVTADSLSPYIGPHILREVRYVDLGN